MRNFVLMVLILDCFYISLCKQDQNTLEGNSNKDNFEGTGTENKSEIVETVQCSQFGINSDPPQEYDKCPSGNVECSKLDFHCISCDCPKRCIYGQTYQATCRPLKAYAANCTGERTFQKDFRCQYCFQSDPKYHKCQDNFSCNSAADPNSRNYIANCSVTRDVLCFGNRVFHKQKNCNWTGGYKWTTALALSITLGGFGADRFYLGHWQEGIGKLFSFGGLGVWTLVDVVMVATRYVGPADGSLYI